MSSFNEEAKRFVFNRQHCQQHPLRSGFEVCFTFIVYLALFFSLAYSSSPYTTIVLIPLLSLTTIRLFILQHDCSHQSLFKSNQLNQYIGHICSLFTLTPYRYWRELHLYHHNHFGIKGDYEIGYMEMLTQEEYDQLSSFGKWKYRVTRAPLLLLFLFGPLVFIIMYRSPFLISKLTKLPHNYNRKHFTPIYWQNLIMAIVVILLYQLFGWAFLGKLLLSYIIAADIALLLFYLQHNTEDIYIVDSKDNWCRQDSAIEGSSFFAIPAWLRWFFGNIQYHHIHHLNPKIPFYHLQQCHQRFADIGLPVNQVQIKDIGYLLSLKLIDEDAKKLVPFR